MFLLATSSQWVWVRNKWSKEGKTGVRRKEISVVSNPVRQVRAVLCSRSVKSVSSRLVLVRWISATLSRCKYFDYECLITRCWWLCLSNEFSLVEHLNVLISGRRFHGECESRTIVYENKPSTTVLHKKRVNPKQESNSHRKLSKWRIYVFTLDYSWCLRPAAVHIWISIWTSLKSCDYSVCWHTRSWMIGKWFPPSFSIAPVNRNWK